MTTPVEPILYCNALNKAGTHCCELDRGHPGKHREEQFTGGYAFWDGDYRQQTVEEATA